MVLDDRLLIEHLLVGLDTVGVEISTTSYWYFRACRAAVAGAGGQLSGPFENLERSEQERAIVSLLELSDEISLPDPRLTVATMAHVVIRHPRLNLLNVEAAAAGLTLGATIWLSPPASRGLLPDVLDSEGVAWRTIELA